MKFLKFLTIFVIVYCITNIILIIINNIKHKKYLNSRRIIYNFALRLYYEIKLKYPYMDLENFVYKGEFTKLDIDAYNIENNQLSRIVKFIQFVDNDNYSIYVFPPSYNEKDLSYIKSENDINYKEIFFAVHNMDGIASINICNMDENLKGDEKGFGFYKSCIIDLAKVLEKNFSTNLILIHDLNNNEAI